MSEQIVTPDTAALTVPNKDAKINLLDLNRQQMREFFKNMGEKPFRADQVMKWMYHYCCDDFDETEWKVYAAGEVFNVPGNSEFHLQVAEPTSYLCRYL